jgi:hypothetical protein
VPAARGAQGPVAPDEGLPIRRFDGAVTWTYVD